MTLHALIVAEIRSASRMLVRKLGFMGKTLAQTELSPSAVHALIEIGAAPGIPAQALCGLLNLDKSSVSRMLRQLALSVISKNAATAATSVKRLHLTPQGEARLSQIHQFSEQQVTQAMGRLTPREQATTLNGLRLYAGALSPPSETVFFRHRDRGGLSARADRPDHRDACKALCAQLRLRPEFRKPRGLGPCRIRRPLDRPRNAIWSALRDGEIVGSVAIDGEDLGGGLAHLRWFIVEDGLQGAASGVGCSPLPWTSSMSRPLRKPICGPLPV